MVWTKIKKDKEIIEGPFTLDQLVGEDVSEEEIVAYMNDGRVKNH